MNRSFLLAFVVVLASATPLFAFQISPDTAARAIQEDFEAGLLDSETELIYRAYAFFDQQSLPLKYRREGRVGDRFSCATPILLEMNKALPTLSGWAKEEIERLLSKTPGRKELRAEPPAVAADVRIDYPDAVILPYVHYTEHFAIRWGDNFSFNAGELDRLAEIAENIWDVEINQMGYTVPWNSDTYYTDVYVGNSGNGAPTIDFQGAYTTVYNHPYDQDNMSYMVFWDEIFRHETSTKDILSHEFFHVCQYQIALAGCYGHMFCEACTWAVEGTAVWAEDEVYDEVNNYMQYVWMYMVEPEITLFSGNQYDPYNRVIFFKYISENFGGRDAVHTIWNECHSDIIRSVQALLSDHELTLEEAFKDFAIKNFFSDYEEGASYPIPRIFRRFSRYPQNQYFESGAIPELFGSNYLLFKPGTNEDDRLNVRIEGQEELWDTVVDWDLTFIKMRSDNSYELEEMIHNEKGSVGEITFTGFGQEWTQIYAVINPFWDRRIDNVPGLTYKLKATRGDDPFPIDDDDDDTGDDDIDDDDIADDDLADDDEQPGDIDCDFLVELIYEGCDLALLNGAAMSAPEASVKCVDGEGPWQCVDECAAQAENCNAFMQCMAGECDLSIESSDDSSGGDDDDDNDACGC